MKASLKMFTRALIPCSCHGKKCPISTEKLRDNTCTNLEMPHSSSPTLSIFTHLRSRKLPFKTSLHLKSFASPSIYSCNQLPNYPQLVEDIPSLKCFKTSQIAIGPQTVVITSSKLTGYPSSYRYSGAALIYSEPTDFLATRLLFQADCNSASVTMLIVALDIYV